jgi:hypothetical protein
MTKEEKSLFCISQFLSLFLSRAFCQDLLNSLLFLQQKRTDNTLLKTSSTAATSVSTRHSTLSLFQIWVSALLQVLNARQGHFAIGAFWALGGLWDFTSRKSATRSSGWANLVGAGVVRMTSGACEAIVTHDVVLK